MTDLATYLAGLQAGDVVIIQQRDGYREDRVTKITPTQVVVGDGRYRRTSKGYGLGSLITTDRWLSRSDIVLPNPRIRMIATIRSVKETLRQDLTLTTIPAMRAALDRAEAALREGEG